MAAVTGQRRRAPTWVVILGIIGIVAAGWAATSLATGTGRGGSATVTLRPLLPGRLSRAAPTPAEIQHAFAAEGLSLMPAGSDLDAGRLGRLRPHVAAAFELSGRSGMLVVLFDRAEPRAPMTVTHTARDRDNGEAAGRIYVEYRTPGLDRPTAAAVRRAFRGLG